MAPAVACETLDSWPEARVRPQRRGKKFRAPLFLFICCVGLLWLCKPVESDDGAHSGLMVPAWIGSPTFRSEVDTRPANNDGSGMPRRQAVQSLSKFLIGEHLISTLTPARVYASDDLPLPADLVKAIKRSAPDLQLAADQLVFDVRPWIVQKDWPKLRELLRGDSVGNSKGYINLVVPVARIVRGNEDLIEGAEDAGLKLEVILNFANRTVWEESEAGRQERLLDAWDDMSGTVGKIMTFINKAIVDQPPLQKLEPLVLPAKDAKDYGRSKEKYDSRCQGAFALGICTR